MEKFYNIHFPSLFVCRQGDIVLVGLREFQKDKADILYKYTVEDARLLQVCKLMNKLKKFSITLLYNNTHSFYEHIVTFTFHSWVLCHSLNIHYYFMFPSIQAYGELPITARIDPTGNTVVNVVFAFDQSFV